MATKRDYYEVLGVSKDATLEQIKKAYHKLALQNHPDTHPGDKAAEERFKEATEAYEVLGDEKKRAAYDQFGFAGIDGAGGTGHDYSHVYQDFSDIFGGHGGFEDIFSSFFGGGMGGGGGARQSQQGPGPGANLRYDVTIDFAQALAGTKVDISYAHQVMCDTCHGTGSEGGDGGTKVCPTCGGSGQVRRNSGFFSIATTCPTCGGTGRVIDHPCSDCHGSGVKRKQTKVRVTIPAGVDTGNHMTLRGMGDAGANGGESGDLYVYINVKPDKYFVRDGADLYLQIPVSFPQAALGSDIQVTNWDGTVLKVNIPSGTQSGKLLRVRDQGAPKLNSTERGDLYIKIQVDTPKRLGLKAKKLMQDLAEAMGSDDHPSPVTFEQ
ncbi:MAG: molecular chaperone DnaJ [Sphaerochaeta sp.]|jgi:molecular chaperone DnaJ|nr:molecular chaperone DnaJ [Sphaerochaeta sp.]MCH3920312.1 molecular chaperone DnaJ [Sphaerochaeta sp.]MCI2077085.1 molecular chaperone DnaJ [Sphaerochaeta sp.]MCI2097223.1 molecular chaperone DnaJ [Sphaerochaeta sp.]MCI2104514.1 molecular chaperone DnaJ [Sphaerochaeta sp.]